MNKSNFLTLMVSSIVSLVILEIGLRLFTPFPINQKSNTISHEQLGYIMDTEMDGIDKHGFRNGPLSSIDVVALGDSNTYGFNVSSNESWPKLLGKELKKNVYNFGVGGYGILQYKYLLHKAISLNTKVIILGLYLPNDLNDVCKLLSSNQYWSLELRDIQIDSSRCLHAKQYSPPKQNRKVTIKSWFKENLATASILSQIKFHLSLLKKVEDNDIMNGIVINEKELKTIIKFDRIHAHKKYMDLTKPNIELGYEMLLSFLLEAKKQTEINNIRFGVVFIPSKERVFYSYLMKKNYDLPAEYHELVLNENELKRRVTKNLKKIRVDFTDTLPEMENALLKYGQIYPLRDEGHPLAIGYQIYADNALKLYNSISK